MNRPPDAVDGAVKSLDELGRANGTDKSSVKHDYLVMYEQALRHLRLTSVSLLEIGVFKGASLRTWRDFFPRGRIVGVDIDPAALQYAGERMEVYLGDQDDPEGLRSFVEAQGPFDVIVDDGSHMWRHQISTMRALLPLVKPGGFYILEDLHTSYGPHRREYGVGGGEPAASFVLRFAERVLGDRFLVLDNEPDPFMAAAGRLVRSVQICGRTAILQRRAVAD
jgi:hypothetical protein